MLELLGRSGKSLKSLTLEELLREELRQAFLTSLVM